MAALFHGSAFPWQLDCSLFALKSRACSASLFNPHTHFLHSLPRTHFPTSSRRTWPRPRYTPAVLPLPSFTHSCTHTPPHTYFLTSVYATLFLHSSGVLALLQEAQAGVLREQSAAASSGGDGRTGSQFHAEIEFSRLILKVLRTLLAHGLPVCMCAHVSCS